MSMAWVSALMVVLGAAVPQLDPAVIERGVVEVGDTARLVRVMDRAERGEPITVGVLGGSITEGARASEPANCYGARVADWWHTTFPKSTITFVNAGIGATGSDLGAHRVQRNLLEKKPDFVVVEYAVNDAGSPLAAETLEGVVRQILSAPQSPAAMLFFTMNQDGASRQEDHVPVGRHYGLPMVSLKDALWPLVEQGTLAWTDFEADEVHPNDTGHAYAAQLITGLLDRVNDSRTEEIATPVIPELPAPLVSDLFEHTQLFTVENLTPTANTGWKECAGDARIGNGWETDQPGSTLTFTVSGDAVSVLFWRIKGGMGRAEAWMDDREPVLLEGWFSADWGGYTPFQLIARDLGPGPHTLHIRLLEEKHEESTGHDFQLRAVMTAGG